MCLLFREDSFIDFVRRNVPGTFGGGGRVLLLDVSVKMEIIDFLQPRIKQELRENIIVTPKKCVTGYLLYSSLIVICENDSWSMFWPRPICPGQGNRDHDQGIILELDVSRGGDRGLGETSLRHFSGQNR